MSYYDDFVKPLAELMLETAKLPADERKAENQKQVFLSELSKFRYDAQPNGTTELYNADGTLLWDSGGNRIATAKQLVSHLFQSYFETDPMKPFPKTEEEYMARLRRPDITPKERIALTDYWNNRPAKKFDANNLRPQTEEEYISRLRDPKITAQERIAITDYWMNKK